MQINHLTSSVKSGAGDLGNEMREKQSFLKSEKEREREKVSYQES